MEGTKSSSDSGQSAEITSALRALLSRGDCGFTGEFGILVKMLLAADSGGGAEALASLRLSSAERGSGAERHGPRTMTRAGTSELRLYPDKGSTGIPSKDVTDEPI